MAGDSSPGALFLREVTDQFFVNISIKGYEKKVGTGFKEEFYAFHVVAILKSTGGSSDEETTKIKEKERFEVWRRYSEFDSLRTFLCTTYPHVIVPPLPEKAIKGSGGLLNKITFTGEDVDFLLKRQRALEIFLVRVSRHPDLANNFWFHQFLQKSGWKELLAQSGFVPKSDSMLQSLSLQLGKQNPDSRFQELKTYASDLESILRSVIELRERFNVVLKSVYKVHGNYGRVFNELCSLEDTLGTALQTAGGWLDSYADSVDSYLEEDDIRFLLPLKEYVGFCEALKMVIKRHELLQRQLEKAESDLSLKAEVKETLLKSTPEEAMAPSKRFSFRNISARLHGKDVTYEGQLTTACEELQEAEEAVSRSQREFEEFTANALKEVERFNTQKNGDFRSMLLNYVQLQMHIHKKGINTWQRIQSSFESPS